LAEAPRSAAAPRSFDHERIDVVQSLRQSGSRFVDIVERVGNGGNVLVTQRPRGPIDELAR